MRHIVLVVSGSSSVCLLSLAPSMLKPLWSPVVEGLDAETWILLVSELIQSSFYTHAVFVRISNARCFLIFTPQMYIPNRLLTYWAEKEACTSLKCIGELRSIEIS